MCSSIRLHRVKRSYGEHFEIKTATSVRTERWGVQIIKNGNLLYNARQETIINSNFWKNLIPNRCILECEGFYEKGMLFRPQESLLMGLAGIYDPGNGFTLITTDSGLVVSKALQRKFRQPIILFPSEYHIFLVDRKLEQFIKYNKNKLRLTA